MIDEGYIKFALEWVEAGALPEDDVHALRHWRKPLYEAGLVGHYPDLNIGYGNISIRCRAGGHFIISGTQTGHLADPGAEGYALVTDYDIAANRVCCRGPVKASSESMTHATLYELSPAINAVVHVHSPALWRRFINDLPTTDAGVAYGTPDMAAEFRRLYRDSEFSHGGLAVMAGHEEGLVSTGSDMATAARRILALHNDEL